jgi:DNA-binding XRE family transcriptional regulator
LYFYYDPGMRKARHRERQDGRTDAAIHNRLAVLRAERGLSRQDLAAALGVNYQTIGYLERGDYNPSLELAFRAAEFFGLPIEAIFSREPFPPMSEALYRRSPSGRGDETGGG